MSGYRSPVTVHLSRFKNMIEVILTYPTPEGSEEIAIENERTTFGRGSEADHYFVDDGLSRLHATIYREGDRLWIVDENSTNGTFVNGAAVSPGGTPLADGDSIRIGHRTTLNVRISDVPASRPASSGQPSVNPVSTSSSAAPAGDPVNYIIPIAVIATAVLIIGISGIFIGINVLGNNQPNIERASDRRTDPKDTGDSEKPDKKESPDPKKTDLKTDEKTDGNIDSNEKTDGDQTPETNLPKGKTYLQMSDSEKLQYVEVKAMKVARMIGNRSAEAIPAAAVAVIKKDVDAYTSRRNSQRQTGSCRIGGNLEQTFERASKNAPFIIRSFYAQGLDPQIGLYLAMIESEHCNCLQSRSGPLGMFQFARAAARENGLSVKDNASPSNPDERCEPEPASRAAAKYMKTLSGRFGTGPLSIPLAIASYNSGQGALSNNLEKALTAGGNQQRSFWTLVSNAENLSKQFKDENIRYVPKFFAAAIIGESPQDFGLNLQPLSTYTK